MRKFLAISLLFLLVLAAPGFAQDSVVVAPDHTVPKDFSLLILALWQVVFPWLTGKLTEKWNSFQGWLATKDAMTVRVVYIAITFAGLQLGKLVGWGAPDDASVWGATAVADVLTAIFGTAMVALGINQQKAKARAGHLG